MITASTARTTKALVLVALTLAAAQVSAAASAGAATQPIVQPLQAANCAPHARVDGRPPGLDQELRALEREIDDGAYATASEAALKAIQRLEAGTSWDCELVAAYLDRFVEAMWRAGRGARPEVLERARRAVVMKEHVLVPGDPGIATSVERLGRVLTSHRDPQAVPTLFKASTQLEAALGPGAAEVALAQHSIGTVYQILESDCVAALSWFHRSLAIREALFGEQSRFVADALVSIGQCLAHQGQFAEARTRQERALAIQEVTLGPLHPEVAVSLSALGHTLVAVGDYPGARLQFERALDIFEHTFGSDFPLAAAALTGLVFVDTMLGEYELATGLMDRALELHRREFGPASSRTAGALLNYATLLGEMGEPARAAELKREAATIFERIEGPLGVDLAITLNNLGVTLAFDLGDYHGAEPVLTRALSIREQRFGPESTWVAATLSNLAGGVYNNVGEYGKARELLLRALAIRERIFGPDHLLLANILDNLSAAHRGLGERDEAMRSMDRALTIRESNLGPSHPDSAELHVSRARLRAERGEFEGARHDAVVGEDVSRDHLVLTASTSSERAALNYAEHRVSAVDLLISMAVESGAQQSGTVAAAWDSVVRSRALVLDQLIQVRRAVREADDEELSRLAEDLHGRNAALSRLIVRGPDDSDAGRYPEVVEQAQRDRDRAEMALATRSAGFRTRLTIEKSGLADVVSALPPGTALVAFVRYKSLALDPSRWGSVPPLTRSTPSYAAFVIGSGEDDPRVVALGEATTIDKLVDQWRKSIMDEAKSTLRSFGKAVAAHRSAGDALRRAVWDPVAAQVRAAEAVVVVPDGSLNLVSLASLPVGEHEYLVERGPAIHYLSSERDLLVSARDEFETGGLLVLHAPDFDDRHSFAALRRNSPTATTAVRHTSASPYRGLAEVCSDFRTMQFDQVPATTEEAREVISIWKRGPRRATHDDREPRPGDDVLSLSRATASESTFKQVASGYRVLHLATHGIFLDDQCRSASSPRGPAGDPGAGVRTAASKNPLLMSGLAFAGANHRNVARPDEDDGVLTAEEIGTLDLVGTEWAVLSACDTGLGAIRAGEGVFGMRRAFRLAGAHTVIMSLWPVDDAATRQWMASLYRHRFTNGESTLEAVNRASIDTLRARRARGESTHPFYWGGFIAAGDWR